MTENECWICGRTAERLEEIFKIENDLIDVLIEKDGGKVSVKLCFVCYSLYMGEGEKER